MKMVVQKISMVSGSSRLVTMLNSAGLMEFRLLVVDSFDKKISS